MQRLKKFITASVLGMSVLSMTIVASPVSAATPGAGDLFKTKTDSAVYYMGADNKRYVFPNENTYRTWFVNTAGKADFKSVTIKIITDAEMNAITRGGTVRFRPGTAILKFNANDTDMYAVEPGGKLRAITSAVASTVYGTDWASKVFVASAFSFNDYAVTTPLVAGTYPIGTVLNPTGTSDLFYWDGATYRKFANDSALLANGMSFKHVVKTATAITATGAAIAGAEAGINNTTMAMAGGTVAGPATGTGSGLTVALASDTPAAATYIRQSATIAQGVAPFTKINFTASNDGDIVVTTVKLTRSGISADTDLSNIYLYDGNTKVAEHTSFNSKVITFTNTAGLFTVAKGTTKTLTVKADIAGGTTTVSGIALGVNAASDIVAGTAVVSGSFPFTGNTMAVGTVSDLGYLNITTVTAANYPATIDPGVTATEVFRMNVTANSQDMMLEGLRFTLVGTIGTSDVTNLMLKDTAGTQIGATVANMNSAKEVFFDATANPYKIASGQTKTLVVYADVPTGSARTFRFTIRKSADVVAKDNGYGVYVAPLYNSLAFTLIDATSATTINSGTVTSGIATDTPVGNVAAGATGVTLAKYTLKANGEDVKVNYIRVGSGSTGPVAVEDFKNGKLLWNGSQVGSTDTVVSTTTANAFTVNQVIPAGQTVTVTYQADTVNNRTGAALSGTILASLIVATSGDATGQASLSNVEITGVAGKTLTLSTGTLTAAANLAFGNMATANPTGVKGATNVKIASFIVTAGTGEGSSITQLVVRDHAAHATPFNIGDNFQNLKLMNGTTQLGATQGTLAHLGNDVYTFNVSPAVNLAAGQQMVVDVYADILTGATGYNTGYTANPVGLDFVSVTGTGSVTSAATTYGSRTDALQTLYISANGNMTITAETIDDAQFVMGSTENTIGTFNFNASTSSEAISVSMIKIKASTNGTSFSNIKFYDGTTLLGTVASFDAANGYATLNLATNWVINKVNKVLTVKADVNDAASATSGTACTFSIVDANSITSLGAGSGQAIPETVGTVNGITATPYKTKLTVSKSASSPSGAAAAMAGQTVAIFSFTNSANVASQTATVSDIALTISTSGTWTQWANGTSKSITIRKNSTSGTLLGTSAAQMAPISVSAGAWDGTTLVDFDVAAGATVDLYVIVDTSNAPATTGKLTASLATGSVTWTDGVTASIGTVNSLPVIAGTLSY